MFPEYTGDDIYCDLILTGTIKVDIIRESRFCLAFNHISPIWPVHILVVTKRHIPSLVGFKPEELIIFDDLMHMVRGVAAVVKFKEGNVNVSASVGISQKYSHAYFEVYAGDQLP